MAFEGCDRSGKSTQCQMLVEYLKSIGRDVAHLRFPGNSFLTFFMFFMLLLKHECTVKIFDPVLFMSVLSFQ